MDNASKQDVTDTAVPTEAKLTQRQVTKLLSDLENKMMASTESLILQKVEEAKLEVEETYREQITSIKKQVNTQSKTYEETTNKIDKLTRQSAVLTQNLKESQAVLQKTQTSRNVIEDIKTKIEFQYRQAQSLVDKNREHEKIVLNLLASAQETSTKLTTVSMTTKTVADQFTAWMKNTTKDSKNGV